MSNKIEENVFNLINEIGYKGSLLDRNQFSTAIQEGPKNIEFTRLVSFLAGELRLLANIDECVNAVTTSEDSITFILEVSSFLKESGCPYTSLTHGHASDRFGTVEDRLLLLEYLVTEVMAARILYENKPEKKLELKLNETDQAADMRKILQTLGFSRPPPNITIQALLQKLTQSVQNTVQRAGPELVGNSLFNGMLSEKQWEKLNDVHKELHEDYTIRREMLLKRLDCTIQSFQWSDKTKGKEDLFNKMYTEKRKLLKVEPDVDISDLLASRDDLAIIEKTSSASVRKNTKSAINKVIIGQVPDRGGRTSEQAPPPPEMPPWQQRSAGPPSGGGRGGRQGQFDNRGGSANFGRGDSNYSRGGGNQGYGGNQSYGGNQGYMSAGGQKSYSQSNYNQGNQQSYTRSSGAFDSAGSFGGRSNNFSNNSGGGRGSTFGSGGSTFGSGGSTFGGRGTSFGSGGSSFGSGGSTFGSGSSTFGRGGDNYRSGGSSFGNGSSSFGSGGGTFGGGGSTFGSGGSSLGSGGSSLRSGGNTFGSGGSTIRSGGSSFGNGTSSLSRSGSDLSRDYNRGGSDYGRSGNDYNRGGSNYNRGGNEYNRGESDYNRGGSDYNRGGSDYNRGGSNYSKGTSDYSRSNVAFDSAGSFGLTSGSSSNNYGKSNAGGYSDYSEPKRQKTLDQFQQSKSTYADQYVQESRNNQQYRPRSENTGRGRSNYSRGGYR